MIIYRYYMKHKLIKNDRISKILSLVLAIAVLVIFYYLVGCPIRWISGITCPSCGMTRAAISLLKFDFASAFNYHPLIFILPIIAIIYCIRNHLTKKTQTIFLFIFIALFFIVYILRLFAGSEIVYIDFKSGIIYKIFIFLKEY